MACAIAAAALAVLYVGTDGDQRFWIVLAFGGAAILSGGVAVIAALRTALPPPEHRMRRFVVAPGRFTAPYETDLSLARGVLILAAGWLVTMAVERQPASIIGPAVVLVICWRAAYQPPSLTLTPAGVVIQSILERRAIAWGEPVQIPRNLAVDPWFISAAIQWYAHHADERPGIGTPAGHDRLLTALEVPSTAEPAAASRPPTPRNLVYATWLTWAGAGIGTLTAAADVILAMTFRSRLDSIDPDGGFAFVIGSAVVWLVTAIIAGLGAIGLLSAVRRCSDPARIGLAGLAGLAAASSACPMGSPILQLTESEAPLASLVLFGWLVGKTATAAPAIAVVVLLMTESVRAYCRPWVGVRR